MELYYKRLIHIFSARRVFKVVENASGRAVSGALHDAEVGAPWADGVAVLMGHDPRELVEVREVVHRPGGEKLGESDGSEGGMMTATVEILRAQV